MAKAFLVSIALLFTTIGNAQNLASARKVLDTLTSTEMWGRGYTKDGMAKAANYIEQSFKAKGLQPLASSGYRQNFSYPVNTFPGKMDLKINGKELEAGKDFILSADSRGVKAKGKLVQADSTTFINRDARLMVKLVDKLTMSVSQEQADYTFIELRKAAIDAQPKDFKADIEAELLPEFKTANICAYIKGSAQPDSFLVITAHYDHLGGFGSNAYFPGANDNASGTALMLSLADYYSKNKPKYSIAFIAFAGEEAGLLGSKYYTQHPVFPLKQISFLINTDLAGTGEDGITVVNATEFPVAFAYMNQVNDNLHLLKKINARGKAANSDHYPFSEKGVPAFFFYTLGGIAAYHDVWDKSATLPLNEHEDLMKLVIGFNEKIMSRN